jgi:hypothetical protein
MVISHDEHARPAHPRASRFALGAAIALAVYVLSFGPVVYVNEKADLGMFDLSNRTGLILFYPHLLAAYVLPPYHSYTKRCAEAAGACAVHTHKEDRYVFEKYIR